MNLNYPPMGWNSYDYYDTTVNEAQVRANAEYMAKHLKSCGWEYVVVDIAWYSREAGKNRDLYQYVPFAEMQIDEYSRLLPDENRFPSAKGGNGFKPLADYIHSMGLKFGIHIMRGIPRRAAYMRTKIKGSTATANEIADPYSICTWNPDMYGVKPGIPGAQEYYNSLIELYAGWGVDFIKCDDICRMDAASSRDEIRMLHKAIEASGRDIVLSLSPGPAMVAEHDFYAANADMWRITDDFWDNWKSLLDMFVRCKNWQPFAGKGGYPDCDMLPLGKIGKGFGKERSTNFTPDEQKTMLTLWCIFRSPLMLGAELTKLDEATLLLLTNQPVYEMLKRTSGATEVFGNKQIIAWRASSPEKEYLAVFNISEKKLTVPKKTFAKGWNGSTELWTNKKAEKLNKLEIPPHGVVLLCK